jgi:hypothetical protein
MKTQLFAVFLATLLLMKNVCALEDNSLQEIENARSLAPPVRTKAPSLPPTSVPSRAPTVPEVVVPSSAFNIEIYYASALTDVQKQAFELARAKWMSVVTADLPSSVTLSAGRWCGFKMSTTVIDDLLIAVRLKSIDGPLGILGQAGPCGLDNSGFPRFGTMEFDIADVDLMINDGIFNAVILHEMGHVL